MCKKSSMESPYIVLGAYKPALLN
ncbi:hypothetical protein DESC_350016 [Desulfosarcina cetonica]|nr:hypothetical protein DESC_350016 [Desulfosarcina cetonica]